MHDHYCQDNLFASRWNVRATFARHAIRNEVARVDCLPAFRKWDVELFLTGGCKCLSVDCQWKHRHWWHAFSDFLLATIRSERVLETEWRKLEVNIRDRNTGKYVFSEHVTFDWYSLRHSITDYSQSYFIKN